MFIGIRHTLVRRGSVLFTFTKCHFGGLYNASALDTKRLLALPSGNDYHHFGKVDARCSPYKAASQKRGWVKSVEEPFDSANVICG